MTRLAQTPVTCARARDQRLESTDCVEKGVVEVLIWL
jgi:hypothetical protein